MSHPTNPTDLAAQGIVPLSQASGFHVARGNEDVRGWHVRSADGSKIGKVNELLIDPDAGKVRYLDIEIDGGFFGTSRNVLIPIGMAHLADDEDVVVVDADKDTLREYPEYTGQNLTRDYESSMTSRFASGATRDDTRAGDARFYDEAGLYRNRGGELTDQSRNAGNERETRVTRSEEELAIGKRSVRAGEAYLRKTVETEHVREEVPVMHEEVVVERRPVSADSATDVTIGEDEIRVPVMEEEVVTEKRVVPKEEVVIRKRAVSDREVVEDDVRKERIDVDDSSARGRSRQSERTDRDTRDETDRRP
jgi:uncharacterized protein (TIGR02271 family)